jgi:uncharacterized protein (DUF1697 family)
VLCNPSRLRYVALVRAINAGAGSNYGRDNYKTFFMETITTAIPT